jgi:hypothetical protein
MLINIFYASNMAAMGCVGGSHAFSGDSNTACAAAGRAALPASACHVFRRSLLRILSPGHCLLLPPLVGAGTCDAPLEACGSCIVDGLSMQLRRPHAKSGRTDGLAQNCLS